IVAPTATRRASRPRFCASDTAASMRAIVGGPSWKGDRRANMAVVTAGDRDEPEVLAGGVGNAGAVVRVGDEVHRPTNAHSPAIHALLLHLEAVGFNGTPRVIAVGPDGRERLRFIGGDVPIPPFPAWSQRDGVLASTAALLRRYHDAVAGFA